ncbi:MAG TPA: hypothetical protein VF128_08580 [Gemmatimonadaceae bacterium]
MRRYVQGIALLAACIVAMTASCRRTQPSLIDRNQPPDTQLWYAPPDSSDYEYTVHMYWRGVDQDGTTRRFIWAIQDTIAAQGLAWNPALRLRDYRLGRVTSRTDSVFSFKAYKDISGVGVRKNRQAFFVAAIDDNGVIDPVPAAVEFVATIAELPRMHFTNHINGVAKPYVYSVPPRDTVGMYEPFGISYHGSTVNGHVRGYQYFPLSTSIVIPGSGIWTEDLGDTCRGFIEDVCQQFPNTVAENIPAGTFRFGARCIDDAGAESQVDAGQFRHGVAQVVVNFDPDTKLTDARYSAFFNLKPDIINAPLNFSDNVPDTVPNRAWVTMYYEGHDARYRSGGNWVYRDHILCSPADPDECINFQVKVFRQSVRLYPAGTEDSNWLPTSPAVHDSDAFSSADSNSVNISTFEYDLYASGVDENGTRDGTPARLHVIGNYDPTMDTFSLTNHLGEPLNTSGAIDTLDWNFWKGYGWPYDSPADTVQTDDRFFKEFGFIIHATGHDDARDPDGSAVKTWRYALYTDFQSLDNPGTIQNVGRSSTGWIPGNAENLFNELAKNRVRYDDPTGDDVFADLEGKGLGFVNQVVTLVVVGSDTGISEPQFPQYVFWDEVPFGQTAGDGVSEKNLINSINVAGMGRWTETKVVQFYLKFHR